MMLKIQEWPSYTPPQNRGGERDSLVTIGYKKQIDKDEKIAIIRLEKYTIFIWR